MIVSIFGTAVAATRISLKTKGQRLGVLVIREEQRSERLRRFFHVSVNAMLADLLTKREDFTSPTLHELATGGDWTLLILTSTPRIRHQHTVATHACIFLEGVIGDNDAARALKCAEGV